MEKKQVNVWLVYMESNVGGEIYFDAIPCASLKIARKTLRFEKDWLMNNTKHFGGYSDDELKEEFDVEEDKDRFYINDPSDDYYEEYKVVRRRVLKK